MRYSFAEFVFDTASRELTRDGARVPLTPRPFRLLEALLAARPRALSKQELHELVWPGLYVSDASLTRLVSDLRATLGERGGARRFLRTVHGYGYAFAGEARDENAPPPATPCYLLWGRRLVPLRPGENLLGRDVASIIPFDSAHVSRRHGRIVVSGEAALLEDLGSKNGTTLGGRRITGPTRLADGDVVGIGSIQLVFRSQAGAASTETGLSGLRRKDRQ